MERKIAMTKIPRNPTELRLRIMDEARKSGIYADLSSITITGPHPNRAMNWDIAWVGPGPGLALEKRHPVDMIMRRLGAQFDLARD